MENISAKYINTLTYLLVCLAIAMPFNYANYRLLYPTDGIPAGADNAFHTYSILRILNTNEPLVPYSAFPPLVVDAASYYPSFMHLTIASIARVAAVDQILLEDPAFVIAVEKLFMLVISVAGTIGYAIFIKAILDKLISYKINNHSLVVGDPRYRIASLVISVLAFGIFIYSVSPTIKTFNDGTYTQATAMWSIFPYYLFFLTSQRWIISAILLAIIASTHNLSFLMSLSATLPYILSLILQRTKSLKIKLTKFLVTFIIFGTPGIVFFYLPVVTSVLQGNAAESAQVSLSQDIVQDIVILHVTEGLYYAGVICSVLALIISPRVLGWLSGWVLIYFGVFTLSWLIGQRFARELSVLFGLIVGISIAYILLMSVVTGRKWLSKSRSEMNVAMLSLGKLILIISLSATILPVTFWYFQDRFYDAANPNIVKYYTETVDRSNKYFLTLNDEKNDSKLFSNDKKIIALFGLNPWLKVTTYGNFEVLEVSPAGTTHLSKHDIPVNDELASMVTSPDVNSTACIIKKYNIDYIHLADRIPGRYYGPVQSDIYYEQLDLFQNFTHSAIYDLTKEFFGEDGEHIRIFSINYENVNRACDQTI